jgi:type I restriction-modification system DNA methylase subunit/predicted DNA-binding transcriptional regulator AlpA
MTEKKFITPTEIAELAGQSLPAVSNWMKRFDDFPVGKVIGASKRLQYDKREVVAWLDSRRLSQSSTREYSALLSIDRDSRRDFLGTLFVVLQAIPDRKRASVTTVLEKYQQLASIPGDTIVNFDLSQVPEILVELIPRYKALSDIELHKTLSGTEDGVHGRMAGEFSTPDVLVEFLGSLAPENPKNVLDLASGQGRLLEHLVALGIGQHHEGKDIDVNSVIQARQSARLMGLDIRYTVANGMDAVGSKRSTFVVVDPPLGEKISPEEMRKQDWEIASPSSRDSATAFLVRGAEALEPEGRALVLSSASLLTGGGELAEFRRQLLLAGVIRGIVALPSKLRTNTATPLALWILGAPDYKENDVVMVDASLSSRANLAADGPVVKAILAELEQDTANRDENYATTVPARELLTRDVALRPNAWVAKKRDIIEPKEQLKIAQAGIDAVTALAGELPVSSSDLQMGEIEPILVSLGELQARGSIKLLRSLTARASEDGSGHPVLDHRVLLGERDKASARRLLDSSVTALTIEPGDIVVSAGSRGVTAEIWQEDGWVAGSSVQIIRLRNGLANANFLAAAIRHPRNMAHIDAGALRVQFNFRSFEVPDIPVDEQQRLAVVLSALAAAEKELQDRLVRLSYSARDVTEAIASGTVTIAK